MIRILAALVLSGLLPVAARAEPGTCAAIAAPGAVDAAIRGPADRARVQAGLRAVFGASDGHLQDGIIGPVTVSFLQRLCETVPLAAGTDAVEGTLDLARGYAALTAAAPGWVAAAGGSAILAGDDAFRRDVVRLTGSTASVAAALAEAATSDCGAVATHDLVLAPADLAAMQAGVAALSAADPGLGALAAPLTETNVGPETRTALARVCEAYQAMAGATALADDMVRLGRVVAAVPDAALTLGTPDFARWLGVKQAVRVTRLLGTVPAVVALLEEYRESAPAVDGAPTPVADACPSAGDGQVPTYYGLDPADLDALAARAGIATALAPVAAERFGDRGDLVEAIEKVLGVGAPDCGAFVVDAAVTRHAPESTVYSLDGSKLQDLALRPPLGGLLPAVAPLQGLESEDRDALTAGIVAAVRDAVGKTIGVAAGAAADAAAAAAEDVSPSPDTPAPGIPPAEAADRPQEFAITDASMLLLQADVADRDFLAAISASPYRPVATRELVRSDAMAALRPVVAGRSEDLTRAGLAEILPNVRPHWRLTEAVTSEIAAAPAFAAVGPDVLGSLRGLSGIAYPNARLFDRALASLAVPIDPGTRAAILDVARKRIDDPYARRKVVPVAADCGCNVERRQNSLVYGFYPFWSYGFAGAEATPRVDFGLVGRIAFDGLLIDANADLRYAPQWNDAAATFTVSAHRHQAAVDLGIRLSGWRGWSEAQVRAAADHVIEELGKTRRRDRVVASAGTLGWLDPWLDRRADGVTFLAEGYTGNPVTGGKADNLVKLLRMVAAGVAGSGQVLNLAVDVPLGEATRGDEPLFQDLRKLLVNLHDPDARVVRNVLVFMERRTKKAKKLLRQRVENSFQGEERIQVLRSIVPVVPPGANASTGQAFAGANVASETVADNSYAQFNDDVVYFQDNFAGIGFWPAPAAGATLPDGSPDRLDAIVAERYYAWTPKVIPAAVRVPLRDGIDGVCTLVCPNRLAFHLAGAATAGLIGALLVLGLYSGRVRSLARRFMLVPILMAGLLGLLVVIVSCDASSLVWAPGAILGMVALMAGSVIFHWYERRLDGPMP